MPARRLHRIADDLVRDLQRLRFTPPVTHVYNPLDYARRPHTAYLRRYGGLEYTPGQVCVTVGA